MRRSRTGSGAFSEDVGLNVSTHSTQSLSAEGLGLGTLSRSGSSGTSLGSLGRIPSNNALNKLYSGGANRFDQALEVVGGLRARESSISDSLSGYFRPRRDSLSDSVNNGYSLVATAATRFEETRPDDDVELASADAPATLLKAGRIGSSLNQSGSLGRIPSNNSLSKLARSPTSSTPTRRPSEKEIELAVSVVTESISTHHPEASTPAPSSSQPDHVQDQELRLLFPLPPAAPPSLFLQIAVEVFLTGDMPNWKAYLQRNHRRSVFHYLLFVSDVVLRGVAQVYLCDNPVTGVLVLCGLICTSWILAAYAVLGTFFATLGALLICRPHFGTITSGMCGYDGALVGCACLVLLDQSLEARTVGVAIVLSFVSGVVHVALTNLMSTIRLPTFTFAFNVTTIAFLLSVKTNNAGIIPLASSAAPDAHPADYTDFSASFLWDASVRGVGQFMFADTTAGGILIILGVMIASRMGALAAWGGAAVAAITAVFLLAVPTAGRVDVRNGLFGYNSAGTCASLAGGVIFDPTVSGSIFGVFGAAFAVLLQTMFKALLGNLFGLPVLTFPFITSTWIMLLTKSKLLVPYPPAGQITRCEVKLWNWIAGTQTSSLASAMAQTEGNDAGSKETSRIQAALRAAHSLLTSAFLFPTEPDSSDGEEV